jgi:predicted flap endonuclease-1-like 5' DNA nuclease
VTPLPAIGRPATRALAERGVASLEQVAGWSRGDLLALHGVGPKAVGILEGALADAGLPPLS